MRTHSRLPLLILVAALAILFYRVLLGEVLFWGLPSLQFYPWREYAFAQLRAGYLPLWNPYNGAGSPLFADYQSSLLYPFSWIGYVLPLAQTMSLLAVLHLFIGGWGMWRFTGRLGLSSLGSGVSTVAFGLTAYLVARLGTYPMIQAAAWLPWLAWAVLRLLDGGRPRAAALIAFFTALLLLAGHAQTAWYSLVLVGLLTVYWLLTHRPIRWRRFAVVIGCLALGAGIAGLQLIATAELLRQSQRSGGVNFDFAMNYSYAPARIINLFAPNAFGTPADGSYITGGAYFEDAIYIGLIPLIGAIAALIGWLRSRRRGADRPAVYATVPFWLLIVVIGFMFALGIHTPIFPFLYTHVPTFDLFQGPERWHLWTVFGLSVLAGIGVTAWGHGYRIRRWAMRLTVACGAAAALSILVLVLSPSTMRAVTLLEQAVVALGLGGVAAGVLTLMQPPQDMPAAYGRWSLIVLLVVAADLVWASWGLNPTVPASFYDPLRVEGMQARRYWPQAAEEAVKFERYFRFDDYLTAYDRRDEVRGSDLPNLNLLDRVPLLNNFEPLLIGHFAEYIDLLESSQNPALLKAADVGIVYDQAGKPQPFDQQAARAWLVTSMCFHADEASLKAALIDPNWQPDQQAHMLGDAGCAAPEPAQGSAEISADTGNSVTLKVAAPRDSWLILADTDYPGWQATVDGKDVPIYRANLNFRAVQVAAGAHEVRFDYRPDWLLPGTLVSIISLLVALLLYRLGA